MVTAFLLYRLWKYVRRGGSECVPLSHHKFSGFVGLVDKDPDVVRGIMIDTGASINIHGKAWFERFVDTVLRPWNLWSNEYSIQDSKITGVEGRPVGTDKGHTVPGNARGVSRRTGRTVDIPLTFSSQEIQGKAPALLGLHH